MYLIKFLIALFFLSSAPVLADDPTPGEVERQEKYLQAYQDAEPANTKDFTNELYNVAFTLFLIIVLLIGGAWLMKKFMTGKLVKMNESSPIKILEQRNISTKTALYIIEVYDKHILVGETVGNVAALAEFPVEDENPSFEQMMQK